MLKGSKRRGRGRNEGASPTYLRAWCVSWNEGRHAAELVTPELTLVRVADKEALNKYATARTAAGASVDKHLKANLSQLLGFDLLTRLEMIDTNDGKLKMGHAAHSTITQTSKRRSLSSARLLRSTDSLSSSMASQMVLTCSSRSLKAIALPEKDGFVTCRPQR